MNPDLNVDIAALSNPNCTCDAGVRKSRPIMGHVVRGRGWCACTGAHGPVARRAQNIAVGTLRPLWKR